MKSFRLLLVLVILSSLSIQTNSKKQNHTSNWAVIVDTSRFWFNYRHAANALSVYHACKRFGLDDDHIILMLAGDVPSCDSRNSFPGTVFNDQEHSYSLYDTSIQVDYRGLEVTVESIIQVLTGRHPINTPSSKRLSTDDGSNVLLYLTGHGGEEFLKVQDTTEISAQDLEDSLKEMNSKGRYNQIFFMADTCQASTLMNRLNVPRMITIGSSKLGQSSYSYTNDYKIGVSLIDRFTFSMLNFFTKLTIKSDGTSKKTLYDLFQSFNSRFMRSEPEWTVKSGSGNSSGNNTVINLDKREEEKVLKNTPITDFFGSVTQVGISKSVGYKRPSGV
jgi:GPI-anchor transamidase subunit K